MKSCRQADRQALPTGGQLAVSMGSRDGKSRWGCPVWPRIKLILDDQHQIHGLGAAQMRCYLAMWQTAVIPKPCLTQ